MPAERQPSPRHSQPAGARGRRFRLLISKGPAVRIQILTGRRWTVGRGEDCDVRLLDPTVALREMVFEIDGDALSFRELSTTSRVLLDGRPHQRGRLAPGSTLLVGTTRLTVEELGRNTRVRMVDRPGHRAPARLSRKAPPATPAADSSQELSALLPLLQPASPREGPGDVAKAALEAALDVLQREVGMLARIDGERAVVLASSTRQGAELRIPRPLLNHARETHEPWSFGEPGKRGTRRDQLVVPLGESNDGILLVADAKPGAPQSPELAKLVGAMVWYRVAHADGRRDLRGSLASWRQHRAPTALLASRRLQTVRNKLRQAARSELPVYLIGEPGTEKAELASYLHARGEHPDARFVALHCGLLPAHEQRAELTAAVGRAAGGTLFLEDPEELALEAQRELAAALGGVRCRLVGAAVRSADEAVRDGALDPTLAERFGSLRLTVPPLRAGPADIVPLAERVLAELATDAGQPTATLTDAAKRCLVAYGWPGNFDELRAAIESAAARSRQKKIAPRHLPPEVRDPAGQRAPALASLATIEKHHILRVLEVFGGSKRHAAQALGIAPSTLYEKLRRIARDGKDA